MSEEQKKTEVELDQELEDLCNAMLLLCNDKAAANIVVAATMVACVVSHDARFAFNQQMSMQMSGVQSAKEYIQNRKNQQSLENAKVAEEAADAAIRKIMAG